MLRRDFLNGVACISPGLAWAQSSATPTPVFPPELTGLRGSQPGSMDAAHAAAWAVETSSGKALKDDESWDLVVVGAGISGLSAAHFFRKHVKATARILILDNHDDFGGHARRNEFSAGGRTIVSYGGTQSFDTPQNYSAVALALLKELRVDMPALRRAYDLEFFKTHALGMGLYYDGATFERSVLCASSPPSLRAPQYYSRHHVPGLVSPPAFTSQWQTAPLTSTQKDLLRQVINNAPAGRGRDGLRERDIQAESYVDFLRWVYGIQDPALLALLSMPMAEDSALGGYAVSMEAAASAGLLGLGSVAQRRRWFGAEAVDFGVEPAPESDDDAELDGYFYHFPDGAATVARLLVQRLIPAVATFSNATECLGARFDYRQLDRPGHQAVNIRLNSTAVSVANASGGVQIRYLQHGALRQVRASYAIMAGWSGVSAHVVKGLPAQQKEAMRVNIKMPMVYAQVVLRRWHALRQAKVAVAYAPGAPFQFSQMDFPVRIGPCAPPANPNEPVCLLMIRVPGPLLLKAPPPDIFRAGRAELLGQDFAFYEEAIISQLHGMYGAYGMDVHRDIAAITVNRWGHGFVWDEAQYLGQNAYKLAAHRLGNITMAGADSQGNAYLDAAIDAARRAVNELKKLRM